MPPKEAPYHQHLLPSPTQNPSKTPTLPKPSPKEAHHHHSASLFFGDFSLMGVGTPPPIGVGTHHGVSRNVWKRCGDCWGGQRWWWWTGGESEGFCVVEVVCAGSSVLP